MAYCDRCGNFDESHRESMEYPKDSQHCIQDYQPELYYYWDYPIEEDYDWRDAVPHADCLCEICFDILNEEGKSSGSVPVVKLSHNQLNYDFTLL